ncbi:MAG: hypothetical protein M3N29_09505 [Chloroflexota bacterium]|nr:hypothetical protein [Chloroflexota bacterium]
MLPPLELYGAMREAGLGLAALTDHDTMAAYRELVELGVGGAAGEGGAGEGAVAQGPRLISGVEINSVADDALLAMGVQLEEGELHVLGFGMRADDGTFAGRLAAQREARRTRFMLMIEALRQLGYPIDEEIAPVLETEEALGRPHIARALVRAGHVPSVEEAFNRLIDRNGPAYVPRQGLRTRQAIEAINEAGGIAVLAHYPAAPEQPELIDLLIEWGLRGLEVYYRRFEPQTVAAMAEVAHRRALLATGGSDYHGDTMSYAEAQHTTNVPDAVAESLLAALAK